MKKVIIFLIATALIMSVSLLVKAEDTNTSNPHEQVNDLIYSIGSQGYKVKVIYEKGDSTFLAQNYE